MIVAKMKDETNGAAIKEFVGLKPEFALGCIYLQMGVKMLLEKQAIAKDLYLDNKCLRHLMNRMQSKNQKQQPAKSRKFLYYRLVLVYQS